MSKLRHSCQKRNMIVTRERLNNVLTCEMTRAPSGEAPVGTESSREHAQPYSQRWFYRERRQRESYGTVQTVTERASEKHKSSVSFFCYFVIIFTISQSYVWIRRDSDCSFDKSISAKINAAIMRQ